MIFNAPQGVFGNPNAITQCTSSDFALDQCPPDSQAGLITVYANYEGNPNYLLGTAPIYRPRTRAEARPRSSPSSSRPSTSRSTIPVAVRTGSDYGLRFTVSDITQLTPLAGANLTFWGFPADASHDAQRFPKGSPGEPAGCPGLADTSCIASPTSSRASPSTRSPTTRPPAPANR